MDMAEYAKYLAGTKYTWGGNSVEQGFDCSGLSNEVWASQGTKPPGRLNAQAQFDFLRNRGVASGIKRNSLLFFGPDAKNIEHVAIGENTVQMWEAGGEGKTATTAGMVRLRAVTNRKDLIAAFIMDDFLIKEAP